MFRKSAIYLLVLLISGPSIINAAALVDYGVRFTKYVEACENRDTPALECNGKCHLAKLQQQQNPVQPELQLSIFDVEMIENSYEFWQFDDPDISVKNLIIYEDQFLSSHLSDIDVPPPRL